MPDLYGHLTPQGVLNGSLQTIVYANNYNDLINKPSINSVELQGNKTAADLGLLTTGDIPVESVNGKQGVVILDGDDIEYEAGTSVNSKITDLEAEIGSGPVISVNGQQGVVELDGTDINYSLTKTLNQKIDEVAASIPVVSYPVTSVNTKTGDVVLDDTDIEHSSGVSVNSLINTIMNYTPVYGNTASGAIATFDTSLALPLQDCTIAINAVQEGSGTPSPDNVRTINGYSAINISATGKNLLDTSSISGTFAGVTYTNANGIVTINGTKFGSSLTSFTNARVSMRAGISYTFSINLLSGNIRDANQNLRNLQCYLISTNDVNMGWINMNETETIKSITVTPEEDIVVYPRFAWWSDNTIVTDLQLQMQIERNNVPTDYQPFGTYTTIQIGSTVYGGEYDATTGLLTVTHGYVDLGTLTWGYSGTVFYSNVLPTLNAPTNNIICSSYETTPYNVTAANMPDKSIKCYGGSEDKIIYIKDSNYTDPAVFKTAMSGVQLVYELATPQEIQLTPTQISAIVGTNNVFTDTNGNTSVVYACSLKDYIDRQ